MYRQERVLRKQLQTEGVELKPKPKPLQQEMVERDADKTNEWWVKEVQV